MNFTRAAEALHLTQSAVSQQIRQLEDRLGFPLFTRHTRGLRLTSRGNELLQCVQAGFAEIASTIARLDPAGSTTLEVNCLPSLALHWLVPRLTTFYRQHLDISVRVTADLRALTPSIMGDENIDLGIRYEPAERASPGAIMLMDEYLFPVATPEYLARYPHLQAEGSCEGVTFLHDASPWSGAPEYVEWQLWMKAHRPKWLGSLPGPQFNLASMMVSAALNHQGIALGRTAIVLDELRSGRLIDFTKSYLRATADYLILRPTSSFERSAVFFSWLKSQSEVFIQARYALLPGLKAAPAPA